MKYIKLFVSIAIAASVVACHKDEEVTQKPDDDECLTPASAGSGSIIEGEYIISVVRDSSGRSASVTRVLAENDLFSNVITDNFEGSFAYYVMRLSKGEAAKLKNDPRISSVEPDRKISACGCFTVVEPRSVTWNVDKVGYGDGTGKTAWIIDTGIDADHPDLRVDQTRSRSFLAGNTSVEDENGHGTHIAGILGALNNNVGILGVASGATIAALKVLDANGDGKLSGLLNALTFVKSSGRPGDVVNISVGFTEASEILENEIRSIANKGIYFALAAGNNSTYAHTYSPARISGKNIYTVSAVDSLNRFASFSNYGNDVIDFAAPGVRILSSYTNGRYAYLSGTSMAAPHVAGILLINNGKVNSVGSAIGDPDGIGDPLAHQ